MLIHITPLAAQYLSKWREVDFFLTGYTKKHILTSLILTFYYEYNFGWFLELFKQLSYNQEVRDRPQEPEEKSSSLKLAILDFFRFKKFLYCCILLKNTCYVELLVLKFVNTTLSTFQFLINLLAGFYLFFIIIDKNGCPF